MCLYIFGFLYAKAIIYIIYTSIFYTLCIVSSIHLFEIMFVSLLKISIYYSHCAFFTLAFSAAPYTSKMRRLSHIATSSSLKNKGIIWRFYARVMQPVSEMILHFQRRQFKKKKIMSPKCHISFSFFSLFAKRCIFPFLDDLHLNRKKQETS